MFLRTFDLHSISRSLGASPLPPSDEVVLLDYFEPGIAEFKPAIADGLVKSLRGYTIVQGTAVDGEIAFTATPSTATPSTTPSAEITIQTLLGNGWAVLVRKDAPKYIGQGTAIPGFFVSTPAAMLRNAGADGAYALLRPLVPVSSTGRQTVLPKGSDSWFAGAVVAAAAVGVLWVFLARR